MATASHAAPEPPREFSLQRFALGLSVLCVTCVLTNLEATVRNPARLFDVLPPSAAVDRLHLLGMAALMLFGIWLGVVLVFDLGRRRRPLVALWMLSLASFLAPLPSARDDLALAPALAMLGALFATLSWQLERSLQEQPA